MKTLKRMTIRLYTWPAITASMFMMLLVALMLAAIAALAELEGLARGWAEK